MQSGDCNFVVYSANGGSLWAAFERASFDNKKSKLALQDDGNLVIYKPDMTPIWSTGTVDTPPNCTTEYIDMWGGKSEWGTLIFSDFDCFEYVPLVPSPAAFHAPTASGQLCVIYPSYAGKFFHTTCH